MLIKVSHLWKLYLVLILLTGFVNTHLLSSIKKLILYQIDMKQAALETDDFVSNSKN